MLPAEICRRITVTLDQVPDLKTVALILLIPDINVEGGGDAVCD